MQPINQLSVVVANAFLLARTVRGISIHAFLSSINDSIGFPFPVVAVISSSLSIRGKH